MKLTLMRLLQHHATGMIFFGGILVLFCMVPLSAQHKKGAYVRVFLTDGTVVSGELLAVKAGSIVVFDKNADQGNVIETERVDLVKVLRPERVSIGIVAGVAAGVLLAYSACHGDDPDGMTGLTYFIYPPLGAFAGGIFATAVKWTTIPRYPGPDETGGMEVEFLTKLRRYASEDDAYKEATGEKGSGWGNVLQRFHLNVNPALLSQGRLSRTFGEGTYRFMDAANTETNAFKTSSSFDEEIGVYSSFWNSLHFGVSFDITPRLSGGIEYSRLGPLESDFFFRLSFVEESSGKEFYHSDYDEYCHSLQTLMLGFEWNSDSFPSKRSLRLTLGAMAGVARVRLDREFNFPLQTDQIFPIDRWAFSANARLACELYLGPILTARAFLDYFYAMASFPEIHGTAELDFISRNNDDPAVFRPVEIMFPVRQFGFKGPLFGIGVTLAPFARRR